jgi:acyl carrier protein
MERKHVKLIVVETLSDKLGFPQHEITEATNIETGLGADSLDFIELTMEFESIFETSYRDEEISEIRLVSDIIDFIDASPKFTNVTKA